MKEKKIGEFEIGIETDDSTEKVGVLETVDTRHMVERTLKFGYGNSTINRAPISKAITKLVLYIIAILIVLIITMGIIMFIISMPGMAVEQLGVLSNKLGKRINSLYTSDSVSLSDKNIYEVYDYLEEMGYDIKGYGFLTKYVDRDSNGDLIDKTDDGVLRYESGKNEGKIKEAESDYLLIYLLSDNYLYSYANNVENEKLGLAGVVQNLPDSTVFNRMKQLINKLYPKWGTGLLGVYIDGGGSDGYGIKGSSYGSVFGWGNINFEEEQNKLVVKRSSDVNDSIKYNMSGWTGKFGVPMELLLSLHLSTMMPDLSYDLATSSDSEVEMLLHNFDKGEFQYGYEEVVDSSSSEEATEGGAVDKSEPETRNVYIPEEVIKQAASDDPEVRALSGLNMDVDTAKAILAAMKNAANYGKFDVYISKVNNHWFRDIYYVLNGNEDITITDSENELDYKDRISLYETYTAADNVPSEKIGEFKLYEIDNNGNYRLFNGTYEDAVNQGINVTKKAVTIKPNSSLREYSWNSDFMHKWSSYYDSGAGDDIYLRAYSNPADEIQASIYVEVYGGNHIVQSGEAVRGVTNPEVKNMFLSNEYFRYDGSTKTAEIITELREKRNIEYGAIRKDGRLVGITEQEYNEPIKLSDGNTYKISDYTSKVSTDQDAMSVFSMLESTHTIDSDYVYRDFKELVYEIGYYDKEEIGNNPPRLLQWIIPRIGSFGYPIKSLDKVENEYGTLLHAKADYQAYDNQKVASLFKDNKNNNITVASNNTDLSSNYYAEYDGSIDASPIDPTCDGYEETKGKLYNDYIKKYGNNITVANNNKSTEFFQYVAGDKRKMNSLSGSLGSTILKELEDAGWDDIKEIVDGQNNSFNVSNVPYSSGNNEQYVKWLKSLGSVFEEYAGGSKKTGGDTLEEFTDACKYVYGLMYIAGFEYCAGEKERDGAFFEGSSGYQVPSAYDAYYPTGSIHTTCYGHQPEIDNCMLNHEFLTCCNFTVDKVYKKAGLMGGKDQPSSSCAYESMVENFGAEIITEPCDLHVGDIIECFKVDNHNDPNPHHWSDWGHVMFVGEETEDTITIYTTGHDFTSPGTFRAVVQKSSPRTTGEGGLGNWPGWVGLHLWDLYSGKIYEGYKGNEAVVSPVTGVLLEYGTYRNQEDSITGEKYRLNTDLAYNSNKNEIKDLGFEEMDVHDKVGYAKILVLDAENYQKLEKLTNNKWKNNSLLRTNTENGNYYKDVIKTKDEEEHLQQVDKTVYGFKEFAEEYEQYGISGYTIFIDGFACEEPRQKG